MASLTRATEIVHAALGVFAQLLFSRSRVTGALLVAAMATDPPCLLAGLASVALAALLVRSLGIPAVCIHEGPYGYNALLLGAGLAHGFEPSAASSCLWLGATALCVIVTAAMSTHLDRLTGLPVLSLPFLVVFSLALGVSSAMGLVPAPPTTVYSLAPMVDRFVPGITPFFESLGALVFAPRLEAGALVLVALLAHSRISTLLSVLSFVLAATVWSTLGLSTLGSSALASSNVASLASGLFTASSLTSGTGLPAGALVSLGLNAMLVAIAIGGVYFIPSTSSFALALLAAVSASFLTMALDAPMTRLGLPLLILPFNVMVLLTLSATRQRAADRSPRSVDFDPGSPEENLHFYSTRLARFDALYPVSFALPFRGTWQCTQAVNGAFTHQGAWRFAYDFEVRDASGALCSGEGATPEDFHCFHLPVLAAADGTVIQVESSVQDNPIGEQELEHNWGNYVILQHAPGLFSLAAHLAASATPLQPGHFVRRGDVIGSCGSSGRSPRPHLHFQLQGSPVLGAPTLPCRFQDTLSLDDDHAVLAQSREPLEGQTLRNLEPDEHVAELLRFSPGQSIAYCNGDDVEHIEHVLDLWGRQVLCSRERGARLYVGITDDGFVAHDVLGDPGSVLHLFRAALSRVPFERSVSLSWRDHLPPAWMGGRIVRFFHDFIAPFWHRGGVEMEYRRSSEGARQVILGSSVRRDRHGIPVLSTRAVLSPDAGVIQIEVRTRGHVRCTYRKGDNPRVAPEPKKAGLELWRLNERADGNS